MNRSLAKGIFLCAEALRKEPVSRFLAELESNQRLPVAEIERVKAEKLSALLSHTAASNAYYLEKYGCAPTLENFSSLPVLTKSQLREDFEQIAPPEGRGHLDLVVTSGSTGVPLQFYRDRVIFGYSLAALYRGRRWWGLDMGSKEAMLWGVPIGFQSRMKSRLRDLVLNRFREREFNITPEVLADFFVQCRRRRPDYLFGYSSMLYEFALYVNQNGLSGRELKLRAAICSGEKIHDHFREAIHEAFGCPTVSEYGATEVGIIAHECPEGRHHISEDSVHLEILDKASQPVPDGEMGRVVVTVLHSQASPIIRYELNDFATLSTEPCPCGVTLRCLKSIEGRTSEVVIAPDGRVFHGMIFYYIMKDFTERMGTIKQFRLHQRALDRLDFYIVPAGDFGSDAEAYLKQRVREKFGDAMQIKLIYCDEIEREKSGKLRHFETDLDTSEHLARLYSAAD